MRLKQDLPYTRGLLASAILLTVVGVVMVLVFYGG
jgi:putative membrane protein